MKKLISFLLAAVMLISLLPTAALAEEEEAATYSIFDMDIPFENMVDCYRTTSTTIGYMEIEESLQSVTYEYSVAPTYTVTIPSEVKLGQTYTVAANNVVLAYGEYVEVTLSATSGENNAFTLQNEVGDVITYTVTAGGTQVSLGDSVLAVYPGANPRGSTELAFALPQDLKYPGTYTGTVTFTIAVNTAEQTQ